MASKKKDPKWLEFEEDLVAMFQKRWPNLKRTFASGATFGDGDMKEVGNKKSGTFPLGAVDCKYKDNNTISCALAEFEKIEAQRPFGSGDPAIIARKLKNGRTFAIVDLQAFVNILIEYDKLWEEYNEVCFSHAKLLKQLKEPD